MKVMISQDHVVHMSAISLHSELKTVCQDQVDSKFDVLDKLSLQTLDKLSLHSQFS